MKRGDVLPKYIVLIFTFIIIVTGCRETEIQLSENAKIAKDYLEQNEYEVISYQGESNLEITKTELRTMPIQQLWSVQRIEPDEYLNKKIDAILFTIKNHPLDDVFNRGETSVTVWLLDGEVIGGLSSPISKSNDIVGAPYSLNGKTSEEIKGDYSTWLKEWTDKYGD